MQSTTAIILFAFVTRKLVVECIIRAQYSIDKLVNIVVDKLYDQYVKKFIGDLNTSRKAGRRAGEPEAVGRTSKRAAVKQTIGQVVGPEKAGSTDVQATTKRLVQRASDAKVGKRVAGRRTLDMNANKALALKRRGLKLAEMGRDSEAAIQLRAALVFLPHETEILFLLADVEEKLGQPRKALKHYKRATKVEPSDASAYVFMGQVLHHLDKDSEAIETLRAAVRLEPRREDAWSVLGLMHHDCGELGDAQKALSKAVALSPGITSLRAHHACVLRAVGRFDESFNEQLQEAQLASAAVEVPLAMKAQKSSLIFTRPISAPINGRSALAFAPATLAGCSMEYKSPFVITAECGCLAVRLKHSAFSGTIPPKWIERLSRVHVTRVATKAQCEWAIAIAEAHAAETGGWDGCGHHASYQTNSIIVAHNEQLCRWVQALLQNSIWPAINWQFGIEANQLWLEDCFLVKYETNRQAGLAQHVDDSELSFNLLLSDPASFKGGGTAFIDARPKGVTVQPVQGEVITHFGAVKHEGKPVVGGAPRYILTGFVRAQPLAKMWKEIGEQTD